MDRQHLIKPDSESPQWTRWTQRGVRLRNTLRNTVEHPDSVSVVSSVVIQPGLRANRSDHLLIRSPATRNPSPAPRTPGSTPDRAAHRTLAAPTCQLPPRTTRLSPAG